MSRSEKAALGLRILGKWLFCEHRWSAWNLECHRQICQGAGNRKRVQSVEKRLSVEIILMPRGLAPWIIYFNQSKK
jgi:hypothetical protein